MDGGAKALADAYSDYCRFKNEEFEAMEQPTGLGYLASGLTRKGIREFWEWLTVKYDISVARTPRDSFIESSLCKWVGHYVGYLVSTDARRLVPELSVLLAARDTSVFAAENLYAASFDVEIAALNEFKRPDDRRRAALAAATDFNKTFCKVIAEALPTEPRLYESVDLGSLYTYMRLASIARQPEAVSAIAQARLPAASAPIISIRDGGEGDYVRRALGASGWLNPDGSLRADPPSPQFYDDSASDLWITEANALRGRPERKWQSAPHGAF